MLDARAIGKVKGELRRPVGAHLRVDCVSMTSDSRPTEFPRRVEKHRSTDSRNRLHPRMRALARA